MQRLQTKGRSSGEEPHPRRFLWLTPPGDRDDHRDDYYGDRDDEDDDELDHHRFFLQTSNLQKNLELGTKMTQYHFRFSYQMHPRKTLQLSVQI